MSVKKMNKKEIAELLGKSYNTVRHWSDDRIVKELTLNCYEVLDIQKTGNRVSYTLRYKEQDMDIYVFIKGEFKVKTPEKFLEYTTLKITAIREGGYMSRKTVSEILDISERTLVNWDKKLKEKGILKQTDDYVYLRCEGTGKSYKQTFVSKEEYNAWYRNRFLVGVAEGALLEYNLSQEELRAVFDAIRHKDEYYYYKVRKWIVMEDSPLIKFFSPYIEL